MSGHLNFNSPAESIPMRFRKQTTFNSHDTSFERKNGRLVITNGVKQRCELAINRLVRAGVQGLTARHLADQLNKTFKGSQYSQDDMAYALGRLVKEELITVVDKNADELVYRATRNAADKWHRLPKTIA